VSGEPIKVGDVVEIINGCCPSSKSCIGLECTVVAIGHPRARCFFCGTMSEAIFELSNSEYGFGSIPAEFLRKKRPPAVDDATPRTDFTPAEPEFIEDLARRLNKQEVPS
jgi:hypothetical protein